MIKEGRAVLKLKLSETETAHLLWRKREKTPTTICLSMQQLEKARLLQYGYQSTCDWTTSQSVFVN